MTSRILVVEEQSLVAIGLKLALSGPSWEVETVSGSTTAELVERAEVFKPQCVLLDIHVSGGVGRGIELIAPMTSTGAQVVVLTSDRRRVVLAECLEAGAAGWINMSAAVDEVYATLTNVLSGRAVIGRAERAALLDELRLERATTMSSHAVFAQLTEREALVLGALVDGLSAEEIAEAHFVALSTVRSQIRSVLQKLGVRSQLAAVALAGVHRELLPRRVRPANSRRRTHPGSVLRCAPEFRQ